MGVRRIWLDTWEWSCCGDPFGAGDTVTFQVHPGPGAWLIEHTGSVFASAVDGRESHHDEPGEVEVRGTVLAVEAVELDHEWRRDLIERPAPTPPRPGSVMWMMPVVDTPDDAPQARDGMVWHATLASEIVPGTPVLREIRGVGRDRDPERADARPMPNPVGDERIRRRETVGYLVTLSD